MTREQQRLKAIEAGTWPTVQELKRIAYQKDEKQRTMAIYRKHGLEN